MNKTNYISILAITMCISIFTSCKQEKPNILFIVADDLRPELGCYDHPVIKSPNIDKLAANGMVFKRSYCNIPVCGASRASILTGLRATHSRFLNYDTRAEIDVPNITTLPEHFKNNGYQTISMGKIFHHLDDSPDSWTEEAYRIDNTPELTWRNYITKECLDISNNGKKPGYSREFPDVDDTAYYDGQYADLAIRKLQELKNSDQPFFMGVGFLKPHLPFNAPKKYKDIYDAMDIKVPSNYFATKDAPKASMHEWWELRAYLDVPDTGILDTTLAIDLIKAYYACVSYTDHCVGQVLAELKRLKMDNNTIVVLIGDHGWNLGEHTLWAKHAHYNTSIQAPLIISAPNMKDGETKSLSEFVDIYPTLCELAGLEKPEHLVGKSLVPILKNQNTKVKDEIFITYQGGETVVTDNYNYTIYNKDSTFQEEMLFDMQKDAQQNINVASNPDYEKIINELRARIENNLK